jgi:nicotinamide-nucleotide amidase
MTTLDAAEIIERARSLGLTVAVAESLTGGLVASALVDIAGASQVFIGGIVSYNTELKHTLLAVDEQLLEQEGPVHPLVAEQMALGVRAACATHRVMDAHLTHPDVGVSVTGVAGPDPDAASGQPAGVVWIGVSSRLGERSERREFSGNRASIRAQATYAALELLHDELLVLDQT